MNETMEKLARLQAKLKPLPLEFYEEEHRYVWKPNGEVMSYSVTQVCNRKTPEQMAKIEAKRHEWEPRGNMVHRFGEAMLNHQPLPDPGIYAKWTDELQKHPFWNDFHPLATEFRLCDLKRSIGGSCDAIGLNKNKVCLLDFKSQSSIKSSAYDCTPQLGGYVQMLNDQFDLYVEECRIVWVKPGRTVVSKSFDPDQCSVAFQNCWEEFQTKRQLETAW